MVQTEQISVLMSVHNRRLNKPTVQDKSVMRRLNRKLGGKHAGRLNPDLA